MIAIDMDGTLLPAPGGAISSTNRQALLDAQQAGIQVVIATGRRQLYAMNPLKDLGLAPETLIITSNGAVTRTFSGKWMDRQHLSPEVSRVLCGLLRPYRTTVFTFDRPGPDEMVLESFHDLEQSIAAWVAANREHMTEIQPLERAFDGTEGPIQAMAAGCIASMREAQDLLTSSPWAGQFSTHRTEYPVRDLAILDLLPPGVSKGWALERLATSLGIRREEVMAVGDNWNDEDMLLWAGQPVLMGNASKDLRALARRRGWKLTLTNDQDGVARAIEWALDTLPAASGTGRKLVPGMVQ